MEESLPPGFRFHPTDEELITHYLTCKLSDVCFTSKAITDVDLNKCEPWDLPGKASMGEKEWYFFSLRDRKYPTGLRTNRATEAGYWKTTGKDKEIYSAGSVLVGMKKTLVFYRGRAPRGDKTNWVMHEYRLHNSYKSINKEEWVVCRVFQKSVALKKPQQMPSLEHSPCDTNNDIGDHMELPNLNNNNIGNASTGFVNMISSPQTYNHQDDNMNWHATTWPSCSNNLLMNSNLSVNSLLLKALQLRSSFQAREATSTEYSGTSYLQPQGNMVSNFGMDLSSTTFGGSSSSTSKVLDPSQLQLQSQTHQEQPFNLDSIW